MTFLLRAAFWVSLVLILLPTGSQKPSGAEPQIKVAEAASAATAAVADLSQFCTRQPDSCAVGSQVAAVLGHRVEDGAKFLYDYLTERRQVSAPQQATATGRSDANRADTTGSISNKAARVVLLPRPRPMPSQDTLTASDRQPTWRAPKLRREAQL